MLMTDAELVAKALSDNMSAFQQLIERYKKKIYYTALSTLGNHHDAEDVLQETMLQSLRSLAKLRQPEGFGPWVIRIAFNRSIDLLRKRKRIVNPDVDESGRTLFDYVENESPAGNPDRVVHSSEIGSQIRVVLHELPDSQRSAFMMKHVANLSIREIAIATNSTESTVKTNIYRAVQKLRTELAGLVDGKGALPVGISSGVVT